MTVETSISKSGPYAGAGTTGPFTVNFRFLDASHLQVIRTDGTGEHVLTLTTDYTVAGVGNPTGSVTLVAALPVGQTLTIIRNVPKTQEADYVQNSDFPAESHENALDKLTMIDQQTGERLDRAVVFPASDSSTAVAELPISSIRANNLLGFDADGKPIAVVPIVGSAAAVLVTLASSIGSGLIGFVQSGAGAVPKTVQDVLRKSEPHNNPVTGALQFEWLNDGSALNYASSRAIGVIQHRDTGNGALNELIPGVIDQFNVSGNGVVNSGTELSQTIWQGRFMYMNKTGDGSAHSATITGQLGAVGPGGYNELGGYQGEMTNVGSALGTMSGVEMLLKDSPNAGVNTYSTKMQAIVGRIAKYNPTSRKSHHFYASSEGSLDTTAVLGVNPSGNKFQRGVDFQGAAFSTGQWGLAPNNTALAYLDASNAAQVILGVSNANVTYIRPASAAATLDLQDFAGVSRLQIAGSGGLVKFVNATVTAGATAGGNTLPANPAGFLQISINGGTVKMPYYNV